MIYLYHNLCKKPVGLDLTYTKAHFRYTENYKTLGKNVQKKMEWLDFIKVFGVLATLFLHSNSTLVNFQTSIVAHPVELNMTYWKISVIFASLTGPSFALIFMYLGAVTLSSKHDSISFFMGKIKNLLIPLVYWTLFALLFQKYIMHWDIDIIEGLLLSPFKVVANNMQILYLLISIFLLMPILKIFINNSSRKQQIYFTLLWLYAVTVPLNLETLNAHSYLPMFTGFTGYMVLGYLLTKAPLTKQFTVLGILLFFIGNIWTVWGTIHYSPASNIVQGIYANYFFNRFSIPMFLNSLGSFILLRILAEYLMKSRTFYKVIQSISTVALGMCMVYPYWFVILGTEKIGIELTAFSGNPLWSVPLTALSTIIGSFIAVHIVKRVPYLRHVTPKLY